MEHAAQPQFIDIILHIGGAGYVIIGILLIFSIFSWGIILYKTQRFKQIRRESQRFLELYHENSDLGEVYAACISLQTAPLVRVFKAGYLELQRIRKDMMTIKTDRRSSISVYFPEWVEEFTNVLQESLIRETMLLERMLIFLAVTSSSGPLLGLLGTVWGVMMSFWSVGMQGYSSLAAVAPGVSAALTTTVAGLVAAIPAAIAYNYLLNHVKVFSAEMECFASEFTSVIRRELRKAL